MLEKHEAKHFDGGADSAEPLGTISSTGNHHPAKSEIRKLIIRETLIA